MAAVAIGGTAFLKIDGVQYQLRGNLKVNASTRNRTAVEGMDDTHGYTEKVVTPSIDVEISDAGGLSLTTLKDITASTITAELGNGKTYVLESAWSDGTADLDTVQGMIAMKFCGLSLIELL